jgi:hypothetical protein
MTNTAKECIMCAHSYITIIQEMKLWAFVKKVHSKHLKLQKNVLVLMIRGIHDSWKQPLAYFFVSTSCTANSLKNLIFICIQKLRTISFNVKAVISNLGSNFKLFVDKVGIKPEKPYFNVGELEILYIFYPPYLLKATRNNFFRYKFQSNDKISDFKYLKHL